MRRFLALARSAALEALAEPLSAILFLVALLTVHLVPVFHYHQFGEPGRLARECGFSALLVFGLAFAVAAAVRTIGREIASGTAAAALARPVPRALFFCAKTGGVLAAFGQFAVAVAAATLVAVATAETGARLAAETGGGRLWGAGLAAGVGLTLAAFAGAALLNRFARARFCATACRLLVAAQVAAAALTLPRAADVAWRLAPALAVLAAGCCVFIALGAALAVRLPPAAVTAGVALAVLASFVSPVRAVLPDIQRFWLVDAFAGGGAPSAAALWTAAGAGLLLTALWLALGSALLARREIP